MLNQHNISSKQLERAREALADALEGTEALAFVFQTLRQISEEGVFPFDIQTMDECDAMVMAMNRLLYAQNGQLDHIEAMQGVKTQVSDFIAKSKAKAKAARKPRQTTATVAAAV